MSGFMSEDHDQLEADLFADVEREPQQTHDAIPICGWHQGEPIPDLNALPQERWLEVLRPLSQWTRRHASAGLRTMADVSVAGQIQGDLLMEDDAAKFRATHAPPPRMPAGAPPRRGSSRQINFRLGPSEHARLVAAAELFGTRPTTLARILTIRGVNRALYEERRDR
jgi:hypothetical protein